MFFFSKQDDPLMSQIALYAVHQNSKYRTAHVQKRPLRNVLKLALKQTDNISSIYYMCF